MNPQRRALLLAGLALAIAVIALIVAITTGGNGGHDATPGPTRTPSAANARPARDRQQIAQVAESFQRALDPKSTDNPCRYMTRAAIAFARECDASRLLLEGQQSRSTPHRQLRGCRSQARERGARTFRSIRRLPLGVTGIEFRRACRRGPAGAGAGRDRHDGRRRATARCRSCAMTAASGGSQSDDGARSWRSRHCSRESPRVAATSTTTARASTRPRPARRRARRRRRRRRAPRPRPPRGSARARSRAPALQAPQLSPAQRRAEAPARRAARTFLTGYLPYTYGLARASAIRAAGARLRAQLESEPPRVPPAQRRRGRDAKLAALQTAAVEARRVTLVATVDDGGSGYGALLTVEPDAHDDWRVTEVR